ncbi:hypothetical protein DRN98_00575 [Methanosarcinales archaeon]|uniref:DUF5350 family protein n=1 Tax=Candidatus Syntropharchaeum caldarium TaxID=1838285 RepID=A0A1F2PCS0_9EURY|nr:MAG: hypothetical protein SCAL_000157 [Candidatus Syntrophoarchaeum caldarius]RLG35758.1 MAG: hypothetical protein DRN98_00575 [Methanosarcinales archaeon]
MGKTGSIQWIQIKNRKGKIRLVPEGEAKYKKPGPCQRYDSKGAIRRKIARKKSSILGARRT